MKEKKHIDRIFQEKLKDMEMTPDQSVWDSISADLNTKKKDRKVIPFWWKIGGIAASLLLLFTIGNLIFNNSDDTKTPIIVDTENKDSNIPNDELNSSEKDIITVEKEKISSNNNGEEVNKTSKQLIVGPKITTKSDAIVVSKNQIKSNSNRLANKQTYQTPNNTKEYLAVNQNNKTQTSKINLKDSNLAIVDDKEDAIAGNENESDNPSTENDQNILEDKTEEQVVVQDEKEKLLLTEDLVLNEENIDEKEKEAINRWQVSPNIAPVYFSSLGEGSSIDKQLVNNKKTGEVNMSYGVNVSYAFNDRLSVRSGVNKVDLGYSTKDIIVFESEFSSTSTNVLRNIKTDHNLANLSFLSNNSVSFAQSPSVVPNESSTSLNQNMTFYEIPLELKYALSNKKLGVSVIGGFSTFILSNNEITYENHGQTSVLGKATNINDTSFSANFGFGLDYDISKSINLNIDPMFKYQINTFTNTSGDFKPYFIGVYSGINIKF